jgi:hypothetical protein
VNGLNIEEEMNNYIIRVVSNYSENYSVDWSVGYEGTEDASSTIDMLERILEPHEKIVSIEKIDKDSFDKYYKR